MQERCRASTTVEGEIPDVRRRAHAVSCKHPPSRHATRATLLMEVTIMATYAPIPLAGSLLGDHRHVCAFFDCPEDEYHVMFPFFRDGMARGERGVSIVPRSLSDYGGRLRSAGVDLDAPGGQFEVRYSEDYY